MHGPFRGREAEPDVDVGFVIIIEPVGDGACGLAEELADGRPADAAPSGTSWDLISFVKEETPPTG